MRRRDFITLIGGAAAVWPVMARAQQGSAMRRVGVLSSLPEDDPESVARRGVFEKSLHSLGWALGRDLRIDYRWANNDPATIQKLAAELAALAPDVILTSGNLVIAPMLRVARTAPGSIDTGDRSTRLGIYPKHGPTGRQCHRLYSV